MADLESTMSNALLLVLTGMIAVFLVLGIVVTCSKILLRIINQIEVDVQDMPFTKLKLDGVNPKHEKVILKAIDKISHGKNRVVNISPKTNSSQ